MTEEALHLYEEDVKEQVNRNEARRIRTEIAKARSNPHRASIRWPFELLQNALDAGPRKNRSCVTVRLHHESTKVAFEHDGAPFTTTELAALLSGGSSKEFESDVTTGRYGTGFLATHVLAERASLQGLLAVQDRYEQFEVTLNRSGDEDAILQNIRSCNQAIRAATPIKNIDRCHSARFEYPPTDQAILSAGLEALRQALPYLYATRQNLGQVDISTEETSEIWVPEQTIRESFGDAVVEYRSLRITRNGLALSPIRIFRFMASEGQAAALALVEKANGIWKVQPPRQETPRIYREYPLRGSGFLPVNFVLDGKFDADQERDQLLMTDTDKELLQHSLEAAVTAVRYAFAHQWENAHLLAKVSAPTIAFNAPGDKQWWFEHLTYFAKQLAKLPIVECTIGMLPAITEDEEGSFADFVSPRLSPDRTADETTVDRCWALFDKTTDLYPPKNALASDWTVIAEGWNSFGIDVTLVTLKSLADCVRDQAATLDQLHITGDPKYWLACSLISSASAGVKEIPTFQYSTAFYPTSMNIFARQTNCNETTTFPMS